MDSGSLAIIRFLAACFAGIAGYLFSGTLGIETRIPWSRTQIRATGAFAAFVLVLFMFYIGLPELAQDSIPEPSPEELPASEPANIETATEPEPVPVEEEQVDYSSLESLLQAQQWRAADEETGRILLEIMGKQDSYVDPEDIEALPCEELRNIDALWAQYSDGKFGFAAQQNVWQQLRSPASSFEDLQRFTTRVGWASFINGSLFGYDQLSFDDMALPASLPAYPYLEFWCDKSPEECINKVAPIGLLKRAEMCRL